MNKCELLESCIFFNEKMNSYPTSAQHMREYFCMSNNSECARYMVFKAKGRDMVPRDLFPRQKERAHELIREV